MTQIPRPTGRTPALWRERGKTAGIAAGGALAFMWLLEIIDTLSGHALDQLGIRSWDFADLPSLLTAPFIHFGFEHLLANSLPFLLMGFLVALQGIWQWIKVTGVTGLVSGLFAFFLNPLNVLTAGASGVIFGYTTYLIAKGVVTKRWGDLAMGVVTLVLYGSILWGVLPMQSGVSWQAHLGGAVGGVLCAWWLRRQGRDSRQPPHSLIK